jgi:hypothetical protein
VHRDVQGRTRDGGEACKRGCALTYSVCVTGEHATTE